MPFATAYYFFALVLILTLHEYGHAWVAHRLGDPTAEREGRLSLNPLRHLDFLGTIMIFLAGIGWGKPVPVNPRNFAHPVRDEALTALAGPSVNLIMAFVAALFYGHLPLGSVLGTFCGAVLDLSLVLFVFNMLPFPPLDGSKFYALFLPHRWQAAYHRFLDKSLPYFIVLVVVDLYFLPSVFGFSIVWTFVSTIVFWIKTAFLVMV